MKTRFSRILGVGLTLALLTSLLLTAAPVSALSVPTVTVADSTISAETYYSILFTLGADLDDGDEIIIEFDEDIDFAGITDIGTAKLDGAIAAGTSGDTEIAVTALGTGTINAGTIVTLADSGAADGIYVVTASTEIIDNAVAALPILPGLSGDVTTPPGTVTLALPDPDDPPVVTIAATSGIGSEALEATRVVVDAPVGQVLTIPIASATEIGAGAIVQVVVIGLVNPDDPGNYTLDVSTTNEDAKTSADYEIEVPDIGVLPGIVQQFNAVGILMAQDSGDTAINDMLLTAGADYTIVVGPGEYEIDATITIDQAGLTLESSAGAEDTVIVAKAGADAIQITTDKVTVDGFTIQDTEDGKYAIKVTGADAIVENNIITTEDGYPQLLLYGATGATVSGNELDINTTMMVYNYSDDCTLSDNIFGAGINVKQSTNITITDNDIIGAELWGIFIEAGLSEDILIEGNTISETINDDGTGICITGMAEVNNLEILNNEITDNEGVGILIKTTATWGTGNVIKFNTITGNDADGDGYGIQNDTATPVDATLNWWGTAVSADVAAMVKGTDTGTVDYDPFLADTAEAVFSATATSLDAKDTVGVRVSVANFTVDTIAVAKYIANPEEAIADALAFYDVYVAGTPDEPDKDSTATIRFYAGDANTEVYIWSADTLTWGAVTPVDFSAYGGYVYVTVDPANLTGTPFALVAGTVDAPGEPKILSPVAGDDTVRLRPVFAWETVPDADGYYFQLADNAVFVLPMVKMEGDTGRLVGTTYAYVGEELPYSTAYHWRVKAVSGTIAAGDLAESDWTGSVFITMDEPVEPVPPVVVEPTPPAPPAPIIEPIVEVIVPPATAAMTPGWIYAIIAVGAVLVIALIVLIVRTRRVA